ncbi:MAG: SAM-dependent methyltransferase [Burkholderiales bacterium PBB3]|nr:MAG: SAM-dependent methyltransferase [Burkholderiales bacterium PBB3]
MSPNGLGAETSLPLSLPFSPAADRNKHPILQLLQTVLPAQGNALEIASGTGQHAAWFASHLPGWTWQPTDATADSLPSIEGYAAQLGAHNVLAPCVLDVLQQPWLSDSYSDSASEARFNAIYCANMLHISPWATTAALMQGSARHLAPGGVLITYGPYLEDGIPTAEGNLAFDASLRTQNPAWGIRRIEDVAHVAAQAGLPLRQRHALPANNLLLVWQA